MLETSGCGFVCGYLNLWCFLCPSQNPPDWQEILTYFRGSELQNYFTKILEDDLRAIVKPQYVDQIPKTVKVCDLSRTNIQGPFGSGFGCNCRSVPAGLGGGHPEQEGRLGHSEHRLRSARYKHFKALAVSSLVSV